MHLQQLRTAVADRQGLRLGRKNWMTIFLGVMLTLVVTSVLTPEMMQRLIEAFGRGVMHLFSQRPPSRPPSPS